MMASLSLALSLLQTCHLPCASCQHFSVRRSTFIILHMQAHLFHFQFLHLFPHGPPKTLLGNDFLIMKTQKVNNTAGDLLTFLLSLPFNGNRKNPSYCTEFLKYLFMQWFSFETRKKKKKVC